MKAWDAWADREREAAERQAREREAAAEELAAHGIELDPARTRAGARADDHEHAHDPTEPHASHGHVHDPTEPHASHGHAHDHDAPHTHPASAPGERPVLGIVGAGPVGTALGVAFSRAGWPVAAVASRDPARREAFRRLVPDARGFAEANALVDDVEIVFLTVPDDAVPSVAGDLRLYAGQALVHTSGLLGPEALGAAQAAGTQAGTFHPLVAFADVERAVAALRGATIAIEGDEGLAAHLAELAEGIGGVPVRLAPGSKPAYHAAAVLAAGGVTALLDAIVELGALVGLDEAGALAIYLPLVEQTVGNARSLGVAAALTGPAARGDAGTVAAHRAVLAARAPDVLAVYEALLARDVAIAERRGSLAPEARERLRTALAPRA